MSTDARLARTHPGIDTTRAQQPQYTDAGRLASVLFAPPSPWGWTAAPVPANPPSPQGRPEPPQPWSEPPRPQDPRLHRERSKAVSRAVRRVLVTIVLVAGWAVSHAAISEGVKDLVLGFLRSLDLPDAIGDPLSNALGSARPLLPLVPLVCGTLLAIGVVRSLLAVRRASWAIAAFEQPYRQAREDAKERHDQATRRWQEALARFEADAASARESARLLRDGPQWYPVAPCNPPARVDVIGGDHGRRGWSSLLATMGAAELINGARITLLDFTGDNVGHLLATLAHAAGFSTRVAPLGEGGVGLDLVNSIHPSQLPTCVANAVAARGESVDLRQERALIRHVIQLVQGCLEGPLTLGRLAAGVQVLRQGTAVEPLTPSEITRIAEHVGDLDANEWTARQLRYLASQLAALADITPASPQTYSLWCGDAVSVITTIGPRDDTKETLDRLLLQLAQHALVAVGDQPEMVVLAGADHFGADSLQVFAEHAHKAGVRVVILVEQPGVQLERLLGTGGAVCIMRQYNHKEANLAAEFVGRDHTFVLNQASTQSGTTWSENGGDNFGLSTNDGRNQRARLNGAPGRNTGASSGSGQNWGTSRGWSLADNTGSSESRARVYEFLVEPNALMDMPDTAFLLVDSTGGRRRVSLADADPSIALRDRVSPTPLEVRE